MAGVSESAKAESGTVERTRTRKNKGTRDPALNPGSLIMLRKGEDNLQLSVTRKPNVAQLAILTGGGASRAGQGWAAP